MNYFISERSLTLHLCLCIIGWTCLAIFSNILWAFSVSGILFRALISQTLCRSPEFIFTNPRIPNWVRIKSGGLKKLKIGIRVCWRLWRIWCVIEGEGERSKRRRNGTCLVLVLKKTNVRSLINVFFFKESLKKNRKMSQMCQPIIILTIILTKIEKLNKWLRKKLPK